MLPHPNTIWFHRCLSVHGRGVSASGPGGVSASWFSGVSASVYSPGQTPPQADTPSGRPSGQTPDWADTPWADTPLKWPLERTVRILLECNLVVNVRSNGTTTIIYIVITVAVKMGPKFILMIYTDDKKTLVAMLLFQYLVAVIFIVVSRERVFKSRPYFWHEQAPVLGTCSFLSISSKKYLKHHDEAFWYQSDNWHELQVTLDLKVTWGI